jgi:hypothetical protein
MEAASLAAACSAALAARRQGGGRGAKMRSGTKKGQHTIKDLLNLQIELQNLCRLLQLLIEFIELRSVVAVSEDTHEPRLGGVLGHPFLGLGKGVLQVVQSTDHILREKGEERGIRAAWWVTTGYRFGQVGSTERFERRFHDGQRLLDTLPLTLVVFDPIDGFDHGLDQPNHGIQHRSHTRRARRLRAEGVRTEGRIKSFSAKV